MLIRMFSKFSVSAALLAFGSLALSAVVATGCMLIDPNVADFDLSLPEKDIVIDTSTWQLPSGSALPAVDCSASAGVCSAGIAQLCDAPGICFGSCSADKTCDVKILVSLWHNFDLATEKPELAQIEGKPLVSISINRIAYKVTENTLNIDTPVLTVYAAPEGIMVPGDPGAEVIGTLPPVPAGTTVTEQDVVLTTTGKATLAKFMKNYSQPFNVIVGTEVNLSAGDVVPTGKLTAVVMVSAVAGL